MATNTNLIILSHPLPTRPLPLPPPSMPHAAIHRIDRSTAPPQYYRDAARATLSMEAPRNIGAKTSTASGGKATVEMGQAVSGPDKTPDKQAQSDVMKQKVTELLMTLSVREQEVRRPPALGPDPPAQPSPCPFRSCRVFSMFVCGVSCVSAAKGRGQGPASRREALPPVFSGESLPCARVARMVHEQQCMQKSTAKLG